MQMGASVLVMDDDRGSCLLIKRMLSSLGYMCDVVHNVADGLRALVKNDYSVVFVDHMMPDNTGLVATQAIKLLYRDGVPPMIIGILSYPDEELQQRCESSGMKSVISKPYSKGELSDCLKHDVAQRSNNIAASCNRNNSSMRTGISLESNLKPSEKRHSDTECEVCKLSSMGRRMSLEGSSSSSSSLDLGEVMLQEAGPLQFGELNSSAMY
jgi:CheY-like chemotaxis protein